MNTMMERDYQRWLHKAKWITPSDMAAGVFEEIDKLVAGIALDIHNHADEKFGITLERAVRSARAIVGEELQDLLLRRGSLTYREESHLRQSAAKKGRSGRKAKQKTK